MVGIRPIRTKENYEAALARIADLMDALSRPQGQIEDPEHVGRVELDVLDSPGRGLRVEDGGHGIPHRD